MRVLLEATRLYGSLRRFVDVTSVRRIPPIPTQDSCRECMAGLGFAQSYFRRQSISEEIAEDTTRREMKVRTVIQVIDGRGSHQINGNADGVDE